MRPAGQRGKRCRLASGRGWERPHESRESDKGRRRGLVLLPQGGRKGACRSLPWICSKTAGGNGAQHSPWPRLWVSVVSLLPPPSRSALPPAPMAGLSSTSKARLAQGWIKLPSNPYQGRGHGEGGGECDTWSPLCRTGVGDPVLGQGPKRSRHALGRWPEGLCISEHVR